MNFKIHKAWFMLIYSCVLMMSLALHTTCLSLFTQPVSDALGFPRSSFTIYISIAGILTALTMPIWGRLLPKIGMKSIVCLGGVMISLSFFSMSRSDSLWQFYAAGAVLGVFSPTVCLFPTAVTINNWFVEKKGLAMGIAMAFAGVGAAIFSPPLTGIILSQGWQSGYVTVGIVSLALALPVGLFLLQDSPAKIGLQPYGILAAMSADGKTNRISVSVPYGTAIKSHSFYGIALALFFGTMAMVGLLQHIPAYLINKGFPAVHVGTAMSVFSIAMIFTKIGAGWMNDRLGTIRGVMICYALGFIGILLLMMMQGTGALLFSLIVVAWIMPQSGVWPPILAAVMFGQQDYAKLYPFFQGLAALGYGIGAPLYGLSFDKTGSYNTMMIVSMVIIPIAAALTVVSVKSSGRLKEVSTDE